MLVPSAQRHHQSPVGEQRQRISASRVVSGSNPFLQLGDIMPCLPFTPFLRRQVYGAAALALAITSLLVGCQSSNVPGADGTGASSTIVLEHTSTQFAVPVGGQAGFQAHTVTSGTSTPVTGLYIASVGYGAGQQTGWLTAQLTSTTTPANLTLSVSSGLGAGTYNASVAIASTAAGVTNSPQTMTVTFTVTASAPTPTIALSSPSAGFSAAAGGSSPAQTLIQITNTGTGSLTGLIVGQPTYAPGQPTGWLTTAQLSSTTAPASLTLGVTTGALPAGTYVATLPIFATVAGVTNSPQTVTMTVTVTPGAIGIAGTWSGPASDDTGPGTLSMMLSQNGTSITGTANGSGAPGTVSGILSGSTFTGIMTLSHLGCGITVNFTSQVVGTSMSGTYTGNNACTGPFNNGVFNLTKQ